MYIRFAHKKFQEMDGDNPLMREDSKEMHKEFCEKHEHKECYATYMSYEEPGQDLSAYIAPLVFDMDSEDDVDIARKESIDIYDYFDEVFGIKLDIFFSGNKGFHLIAGQEVLDLGLKVDTITVFKQIARNLKFLKRLKTLDLAIYDRKRLLRLNNTQHGSSGHFKVRITREELGGTLESILVLASNPRTTKAPEFSFNEKFREGFDKTEKASHEAQRKKNEYMPKSIDDIKTLPCIRRMLTEGVGKGERNNACYTVALFMKSQNASEEDTVELLNGFGGLEDKEVARTVKSAFKHNNKFGCNNNDYVLQFCDKSRCKFGYQRMDVEDMFYDSDELVANVKDNILTGKGLSPITLGHPEFDKAWGKRRKEEMMICAADPGMGKTAFAMYVAKKNIDKGNRVLFCSLEMSTETLVERTIAEWAGIPFAELKHHKDVLDGGLNFFDRSKNLLKFFKDNISLGTSELKKVVKADSESGSPFDLIIVDHLGYVRKDKNKSTWEEYSKLLSDLSQIAKQHQVPLLLLSHFNKGQAGASTKPRSVNDIAGSADIRNLTSLLFQLWYPRNDTAELSEFDDDAAPSDGKTLFVCHKNRFGDEKTVGLNYRNGMYE